MVPTLVNDVQRYPANLVALLVGDQYAIVPVPEIGPIIEKASRNRVGRVHGSDIIRKFRCAGAFFWAMKLPLAVSRLVQVFLPCVLVATCERFFTAPLRALSPIDLLTAMVCLPCFGNRRGTALWFRHPRALLFAPGNFSDRRNARWRCLLAASNQQ